MYGISPYIYHKHQPNVGEYTIHGWYGVESISSSWLSIELSLAFQVFQCQVLKEMQGFWKSSYDDEQGQRMQKVQVSWPVVFFKCSRESQVWTIDFESFGIIWFSALHTDISFYGRVMVEEKQVGF